MQATIICFEMLFFAVVHRKEFTHEACADDPLDVGMVLEIASNGLLQERGFGILISQTHGHEQLVVTRSWT